jgi:hypothetical protein
MESKNFTELMQQILEHKEEIRRYDKRIYEIKSCDRNV